MKYQIRKVVHQDDTETYYPEVQLDFTSPFVPLNSIYGCSLLYLEEKEAENVIAACEQHCRDKQPVSETTIDVEVE